MRDENGQTLTHLAVDSRNVSSVMALNEVGAVEKHVNVADNFLMTPMHISGITFNLEIFQLLLKYNPDKEMKDENGSTFIDYLQENEDLEQYEDILKVLN